MRRSQIQRSLSTRRGRILSSGIFTVLMLALCIYMIWTSDEKTLKDYHIPEFPVHLHLAQDLESVRNHVDAVVDIGRSDDVAVDPLTVAEDEWEAEEDDEEENGDEAQDENNGEEVAEEVGEDVAEDAEDDAGKQVSAEDGKLDDNAGLDPEQNEIHDANEDHAQNAGFVSHGELQDVEDGARIAEPGEVAHPEHPD
eukprot:CAMPEP_0182446906 /NCGR_PEP_ID=MMETSP1172-20130603/8631_1 /TAXON_ID=708627 /ORGANISM="Timspurckia oligopyrenoides, Strain CCMP3278" /LENGTH=196 /DNA_ID=CAMNT_0024643087 /DNA_START=1 /DNA_END=591 /DNA_ORIENTATION=+